MRSWNAVAFTPLSKSGTSYRGGAIKVAWFCGSGLTLAIAAASPAALVTFGGLDGRGQTGVPSTYQPLQQTYSGTSADGNPGNPGGAYSDGANLGVQIGWDGTEASSYHAANGGVYDHTNDSAGVVLFDSGENAMTITFSKPVVVPSLFYANFSGGNYSIQFQGYTNASDTTPAVDTGSIPYSQTTGPNNGGYQWIPETGLGNTPIQKLVISGPSYKQIDDMTINLASSTPEPASLGVLAVGAAGLLATRRRRIA